MSGRRPACSEPDQQMTIKPDDFIIRKNTPSSYIDEEDMTQQRPVEMKPYLCRAFITSYEKMNHDSPSYRSIMGSQGRQFADYLLVPEKGYKTIHV